MTDGTHAAILTEPQGRQLRTHMPTMRPQSPRPRLRHTYRFGRPPSVSPLPLVIHRHCPRDLELAANVQPSHGSQHRLFAEVTFAIRLPRRMSHGDKATKRPFAPQVVGASSEGRLSIRMIGSDRGRAQWHWLTGSWWVH